MGIETLNLEANSGDGDLSPCDGWLLDQFIQKRSEEAFALLVKRHGPYIFGVCRRVTQHTQDAEDVFQACFLELSRKGSAISQRNSVAGWLQTVAVRMARKARANRARREHRETMPGLRDPSDAAEDISWREIRRIIEEELAQLPEDLRLPIILCLFEGRTQEEAAESSKMNPRTLKDRLARGRELLQKRLARRGVSLIALGTLLSGGNAAPVSASLHEATLHGATAVANKTALAGVISPGALSLTGGSTLISGWSLLAAVLVSMPAFGAGAYVTWNSFAATSRAASASNAPAKRLTLQRSFRNGKFDAKVFQWTGPRAESYSRRERQGLRLTLPAARGPAQPVGIMLRYPLRGDFEIDATWEMVRVPRPTSGGGIGATMYCFMDSPESDGVWFGKMLHPIRGPEFDAGHRYKKNPERTDKIVKTIPAAHAEGVVHLRIVRQGALFGILGAEQTTTELQSLVNFEVSSADATIVRFAADPAWSSDAAVDVRLVDVCIKAEEIVGYVP